MKRQDISENQAKIVYLGIGSNLGDRKKNIEIAKSHLGENNLDFLSISSKKILKVKNKLTLPHKLMHKRNFVLIPFFEIQKKWHHPIIKKDLKSLISSLSQADIRSIKQI